ncbi:MAG: hypothetical protein V1875_03885 [Candidatus Altiarchaeota archaeon]
MDFVLDKSILKGVRVEENPTTGKLDLVLDIDADRLDKMGIEHLERLSGLPAEVVARSLGTRSVDNIVLMLNEKALRRLDEKSESLKSLKEGLDRG